MNALKPSARMSVECCSCWSADTAATLPPLKCCCCWSADTAATLPPLESCCFWSADTVILQQHPTVGVLIQWHYNRTSAAEVLLLLECWHSDNNSTSTTGVLLLLECWYSDTTIAPLPLECWCSDTTTAPLYRLSGAAAGDARQHLYRRSADTVILQQHLYRRSGAAAGDARQHPLLLIIIKFVSLSIWRVRRKWGANHPHYSRVSGATTHSLSSPAAYSGAGDLLSVPPSLVTLHVDTWGEIIQVILH